MKHPEKTLLHDFALGNMDVTMRLLVESHLNFCTECEHTVSDIRNSQMDNQEIEAFFEDSIPETKVPKLFGKIMTKIQIDEPLKEPSSSQIAGIIPDFLKDDIKPESEWEWTTMWPTKGKIGTVFTDPLSGYSLYIAYFKAGSIAPAHNHLDNEYTVMLQGGYSYGSTDINEGDWDTAQTGTSHSPQVHTDKDCWCIVRSKTVDSVKFEGVASWRQPIIALLKAIDKVRGK